MFNLCSIFTGVCGLSTFFYTILLQHTLKCISITNHPLIQAKIQLQVYNHLVYSAHILHRAKESHLAGNEQSHWATDADNGHGGSASALYYMIYPSPPLVRMRHLTGNG